MDHEARVVTVSVVGLPPYRQARMWVGGKDDCGSLDDGKEIRFSKDFQTDPTATYEDWVRDVIEAVREVL